MDKKELKSLIGQNLSSFTFVMMYEVYHTDFDGRKSSVVGYLKDPNIASAFADSQVDASTTKTSGVLVFTNEVDYYLITDGGTITILNDEEEVVKLREKALSKLSQAERNILGFK